jgi:hypothetical protein
MLPKMFRRHSYGRRVGPRGWWERMGSTAWTRWRRYMELARNSKPSATSNLESLKP